VSEPTCGGGPRAAAGPPQCGASGCTYIPPAFRGSVPFPAGARGRSGARGQRRPRVLQRQSAHPTAGTELVQPLQFLDKMCLQFSRPHGHSADGTTGRVRLELLLPCKIQTHAPVRGCCRLVSRMCTAEFVYLTTKR
jgi:hypothetical protein